MDLSTDVLFADGQDNMAGITKRGFMAFLSAFTSIAKPVSNPSTYAARVSITTAHVLATGQKVIEVYWMYDKSGIESPLVGPRKGKSSKPKLTGFYPGVGADVVGFMDLIKNGDLIAFAKQIDGVDGYIQIGTEDLPASIVTGSVKTGVGPEGEKGITFEIEAPSKAPFYFYTATLPRVGA